MQIFNYIDTVIVFAIPFTTIVILNTFTALAVWKVANVRRTMTVPKRQEESHNFSLYSYQRLLIFKNLRRKSNVKELRKHPHIPNSKVDYSHAPIINSRVCGKSEKRKKTFGFCVSFDFAFGSSEEIGKRFPDQGHEDVAVGVVGFCLPQPP
jgi:hypothetical protein